MLSHLIQPCVWANAFLSTDQKDNHSNLFWNYNDLFAQRNKVRNNNCCRSHLWADHVTLYTPGLWLYETVKECARLCKALQGSARPMTHPPLGKIQLCNIVNCHATLLGFTSLIKTVQRCRGLCKAVHDCTSLYKSVQAYTSLG